MAKKTTNLRAMAMLYALYKFRCLSLEQCRKNYFSEYEFGIFYRGVINPLVRTNYIKLKSSQSGTHVVMLDDRGFNFVKQKWSIPVDVVNDETGEVVHMVRSAKDIEIEPRLINHQVAMNDFVIPLMQQYKKRYSAPFEYFDEKYISFYTQIRPDSVIRIGSLDLFIEQDMGTENRSQLDEKWNRYRLYLENHEHDPQQRKIIVLFVCTCEDAEKRKLLVMKTAKNVFVQMISDSFDIYIGTKKELLNAVFNKILPIHFGSYHIQSKILEPLFSKMHGFSIANGRKLSMKVGGSLYGFYIRKLDNNLHIVKENGKVQEFLLDEYYYTPLSVLSKILYARRTSTNFKIQYKRPIDYIVIVRNEEELFNHLKATNMLDIGEGIYYTTPIRLKTMPFNKALFRFDSTGKKYHFKNTGLVLKEYEE